MGMRRKTIKSILAKKFNDFLSSIPEEFGWLRERFKKHSIVTGGAIASMLLGEEVNDFDVYFRDRETAHMVAIYYVEKFKESNSKFRMRVGDVQLFEDRIKINIKYDDFEPDPMEEDVAKAAETARAAAEVAGAPKQPKYRPIFISPNCISLSDKVQLVVRFFGSPEEIHSNYDFIHCTNYWQSWDGELTLRPKAMEALLAKELVYFGSKYPVCSLMRVRKFVQKGWKINAGQLVKMAWQIHELDLKDPEVLEDQLVGVDTAYFQMLIEKLKEAKQEKVEQEYLFQLIDEIF